MSVDMRGAKKLSRQTKRASGRATEPRDPLAKQAKSLKAIIDENIAKGLVEGGKAKPLKESTKRQKGNGRPLIESGAMAGSVWARFASPQSIVFGAKEFYSSFVQRDRPFIPETFEDKRTKEWRLRTMAAIRDYILGAFGRPRRQGGSR